jgi:hypothetical protein
LAWFLVGAAVVSAAPAIYRGIKGISQTNQANALKPADPGFQMNQGVIDNAKTLSDYYGNYNLPGYSKMLDNVNSNYQTSFENGVQGATSGGDVLDLASKMAFGKNQALNNLGVQTAQGKQAALGDYLQANAQAGQQYQDKNSYERDQYDKQVRAKAALTQAGAQNTYGAVDQLAGTAGKLLTGMGDSSTDKTTVNGGLDKNASSTYNKYFYPNGSPKFDKMGNQLQPDMSSSQQGGGSNLAYN